MNDDIDFVKSSVSSGPSRCNIAIYIVACRMVMNTFSRDCFNANVDDDVNKLREQIKSAKTSTQEDHFAKSFTI